MHHYKIYGLAISSTRKIALLSESEPAAKSDLDVDWIAAGPDTPDKNLEWRQVHTELLKLYAVISLWRNEQTGLTKVTFEMEGREPLDFVVDSGNKRLTIIHHPDELISDLESYLVGPGLGIVMRLRGMVCMHSSVVAINGKAVALLGHSTAGKSTTAAGLANAGAKVMADDIAVLTPKENGFEVQPGYSKVRLRPVAAGFLTENPESLPIVYSTRDSRYVSLDQDKGHNNGALPLVAIYILGNVSEDYNEPSIAPVESKDKLLSLLVNTYGSYVVMDDLRAFEFELLSKVAKTIPIRRLFYSHDISTLPRQCEIILKDIAPLAEAASIA